MSVCIWINAKLKYQCCISFKLNEKHLIQSVLYISTKVAQKLALLPHSKKVLDLNLPVFSLCLQV